MSKQYGFYFDEDRCVGCSDCVVACKSVNDLEAGIQWIRLTESWQGAFPDVKRNFMVKVCVHCENPPCVAACPTGAIYKREEDGLVVVDKSKCNGCRECLAACPYDVPMFGADGLMQKCDGCLSTGRAPECASSCPAEALKFGDLDELREIAKNKNKQAVRLEGSSLPAMIIVT